MKPYYQMSKDEIIQATNNLPTAKDEDVFRAILIIPNGKIHDSGFMCMTLVGCDRDNLISKITDWSDDVRFDVVYNRYQNYTKMDCLPCGIIRAWGSKIKLDFTVSTTQFKYEV